MCVYQSFSTALDKGLRKKKKKIKKKKGKMGKLENIP